MIRQTETPDKHKARYAQVEMDTARSLRRELEKPIKTKLELDRSTTIEHDRRSAARQTSRWDRIAQDRNDRHRSAANVGFA